MACTLEHSKRQGGLSRRAAATVIIARGTERMVVENTVLIHNYHEKHFNHPRALALTGGVRTPPLSTTRRCNSRLPSRTHAFKVPPVEIFRHLTIAINALLLWNQTYS